MNDLRFALKKLLERNQLITTIMPYAFVTVLLYPALSFINSLSYMRFYVLISSVFYILYLVSVLICFAEEMDWAIGVAFGLLGLRYLVYLFTNFTFNSTVYTAFYVLLSFCSLRGIVAGRKTVNINFRSRPIADSQSYIHEPVFHALHNVNSDFCTSCGNPVDPSGAFCPFCVYPYPVNNAPSATPSFRVKIPHNVQYSGSVGILASICGSTMALVFDALLTASIFFSLISSFTVSTVITQIPMILICIGFWMIYSGCVKGNLNETGFTLIIGVLIAKLILSYIPFILCSITGIVLMFQGSDYIGIGIGMLLGCSIIIWLYTMYWLGLRNSVISGRAVLRGGGFQMQSSMFCIVMLCIGALGRLISIATFSSVLSSLGRMIDILSYELYYATGSTQIADAITNYLSSMNGGGGLHIFSELLVVSVMICSAIMLIQIRNQNHVSR